MKIAKILATGATVLILGGTAAGAALASGGSATPSPAESTSTVDTDNIQQGDQTTPDTSATSKATSEQEATSA